MSRKVLDQGVKEGAISLSNVSSPYDLDGNLFRFFLDRDMHYSCAYFTQPGIDLEDAQQAKCRAQVRGDQKRPLRIGRLPGSPGCL